MSDAIEVYSFENQLPVTATASGLSMTVGAASVVVKSDVSDSQIVKNAIYNSWLKKNGGVHQNQLGKAAIRAAAESSTRRANPIIQRWAKELHGDPTVDEKSRKFQVELFQVKPEERAAAIAAEAKEARALFRVVTADNYGAPPASFTSRLSILSKFKAAPADFNSASYQREHQPVVGEVLNIGVRQPSEVTNSTLDPAIEGRMEALWRSDLIIHEQDRDKINDLVACGEYCWVQLFSQQYCVKVDHPLVKEVFKLCHNSMIGSPYVWTIRTNTRRLITADCSHVPVQVAAIPTASEGADVYCKAALLACAYDMEVRVHETGHQLSNLVMQGYMVTGSFDICPMAALGSTAAAQKHLQDDGVDPVLSVEEIKAIMGEAWCAQHGYVQPAEGGVASAARAAAALDDH